MSEVLFFPESYCIIFNPHYFTLYFFYLYYTVSLYFMIYYILILVFHEYRDVFYVFSFHPSRLPACLSSVYLSLRAVFNKVTQCVRAMAKWENRARSVIQCLSL